MSIESMGNTIPSIGLTCTSSMHLRGKNLEEEETAPSTSTADTTTTRKRSVTPNERRRNPKRGSRNEIAFPTPEWGGKAEGTCIVDSFLAILCSVRNRNPQFHLELSATDDWTRACKAFLASTATVDEAKEEFIRTLYEPQILDMFGEESVILHSKSKAASILEMKLRCCKCGHITTDQRDQYFITKESVNGWEDAMMKTATSVRHCLVKGNDGKSCRGIRKLVKIEVPSTTWVLPFDAPQKHDGNDGCIRPLCSEAINFKNTMKVGSTTFFLAGFSIYGACHYSALFPHGNHFLYYDGIHSPKMEQADWEDKELNTSIRGIKTIYYFRQE